MGQTLIVFAYHYPPASAVGAQRPYRFAKYLERRGYPIRVFSAGDPGEAAAANATYLPDPFLTGDRGAGWQVERFVRRFLVPGAGGTRWALQAAQAARKFIR